MNNPAATSLREQLWSPVQNTTLWLAWWLHGLVGADVLIDAFHEVQGPVHRFVPQADSLAPEANSLAPGGLVDMLRRIRQVTDAAPVGPDVRPLVGLALSGPGDVPPLPASSAAARAVVESGSGILVADADPEITHVVVPRVERDVVASEHNPSRGAEEIVWTWHTASGKAPALPVYSPGEADRLLREAVDGAASAVDSPGRFPHGRQDYGRASLRVGVLSDAFGLPGLPANVPDRAAKLMARADVVAAIVEVARASEVGTHIDPQLIPLLRAVRTARMVAVDYASRELVRAGL